MPVVFPPSAEATPAIAAHGFFPSPESDLMAAATVGRAVIPRQRVAMLRSIAERSVMEMALYTFGDFRTAEDWMCTYHPHLKIEPAEACREAVGLVMVVQLLQAISHGTEP